VDRRLSALVAVALAATLALSLGGCRRRSEPPLQAPPGADGPTVAERVRVLNADVLIVDGRHVRLADAAAPQPIPDARCWAEALAARLATAAVRGRINDAETIRLQPTGRTDEYNRTIAQVFLDNQDLAASLHDDGLVASGGPARFGWCTPISEQEPGAPDVRSLMDFSR